MQQVTFTVIETTDGHRRKIHVTPSLHNIRWSNGGDAVLMSIAANCIRMLARENGLEASLESFSEFVISKTRVIP